MTAKIKLLALTAALAAGLLCAAARADTGSDMRGADGALSLGAGELPEKPAPATPAYIAMAWYRLAGQTPDFPELVRQSDAYLKTPEYARLPVLDSQVKELQQTYNLLAAGDQFTADLPATLSDYSLDNKGYFVDSLKDDTFLKVRYAGQDYAIVPRGIVDRAWISVDGLPAKAIDDLRVGSPDGRSVTLTLSLTPLSAAPKPIDIDGVSYHVIAAEVSTVSIFDAAGKTLWRGEKPAAAAPEKEKEQKNELMHLYH